MTKATLRTKQAEAYIRHQLLSEGTEEEAIPKDV